MGTNLDFVRDWQGNMIQDQTAFTSIHEVVHLLTLNNTQIAETEGNGPTFYAGEGCSNPNAYVNVFYNQF